MVSDKQNQRPELLENSSSLFLLSSFHLLPSHSFLSPLSLSLFPRPKPKAVSRDCSEFGGGTEPGIFQINECLTHIPLRGSPHTSPFLFFFFPRFIEHASRILAPFYRREMSPVPTPNYIVTTYDAQPSKLSPLRCFFTTIGPAPVFFPRGKRILRRTVPARSTSLSFRVITVSPRTMRDCVILMCREGTTTWKKRRENQRGSFRVGGQLCITLLERK